MPEFDCGLVAILPGAITSILNRRYLWTDELLEMILKAVEMVAHNG